MAIKIENYLPVVQYNGLNTDKAVVFGSTLEVTGAITATAGISGPMAGAVSATTLTTSGLTKIKNPVIQSTITTLDAQTGTMTIAQMLGGTYLQNSKTGASSVTTPTGAEMSAGISGVAVGSKFDVLYHNYGNQTSTITAGASGVTLVGGTAAVTTGKHVTMTCVCTAADTWSIYLTTLY